jgi:hypothetical protein
VSTFEAQAAKIDLLFRTVHVFSMNPRERAQVASNLANAGLTARQVRLVFDEARASTRDDESARGLFVVKAREPNLIREIAADVQERIDLLRGGAGTEPSEMRFVADGNPYGWKSRDLAARDDHSRPGEWNAFRQGYNLTADEARAAGVRDVRRHGCSRVEVVGEFDKARVKAGSVRAAAPEWDGEAVAVTQEALAAAGSAGEDRKVYGE